MSDIKESKTEERIITRKDLRRANIRWLFVSQICWNYERMMSTGYLFAILPILRILYGHDKEKLRDMSQRHLQFFNTTPQMGHIILGMNIAIEEKEGYAARESVTGIKTGLMGPLAGIGDSIFGVTAGTILGSIAAYMALDGSFLGIIIWFIAALVIVGIRLRFLYMGYNQGINLVTTLRDRLNYVTEAATILGLTVIGALIPTVVNADVTYVYEAGEVSLSLAEILDEVSPALVPLLFVIFAYWLLGFKIINSTRLILFVMVLGIVLSSLNVLG